MPYELPRRVRERNVLLEQIPGKVLDGKYPGCKLAFIN
jgi:hypothetical protein